jgi:Tol biopolymer transport system component
MINTSYHDSHPRISADGLTLFFASNRPGGLGGFDLWVATRASAGGDWCAPVNLGSVVNSPAQDYSPSISPDGLTLYFYSDLVGGQYRGDLCETTRKTKDDPWGTPLELGQPINSDSDDSSPNISADGLSLFFCSNRGGGLGSYDLYVTTRASVGDYWSPPVNLGSPVNSSVYDFDPSISADGLTLFFTSNRGGLGSYDLYVTTRNATDAPWSTPMNLGAAVNTSYSDIGPCIGGDDLLLYFCDWPYSSPRPGGFGNADIWQVSVERVVPSAVEHWRVHQ